MGWKRYCNQTYMSMILLFIRMLTERCVFDTHISIKKEQIENTELDNLTPKNSILCIKALAAFPKQLFWDKL